MRAAAGEVLHFSENPDITAFAPHVAATAQQPEAYVWAVDGPRCPDYWFPRQCPRAMAWADSWTTAEDADRLLGPGVDRVHLAEYGWLEAIGTAELYAYRFDARDFRPIGDPPHALVAEDEVTPLGPPERVGDLLALHEAAGIELRLTASLADAEHGWWAAVIASSLQFSGIRLRNAGLVRRSDPAGPRG